MYNTTNNNHLLSFIHQQNSSSATAMTSCDSLQQIFQNPPLPENPTLIESLSTWNHIKPKQPNELSSFTEIFGELHFKETHESSSLPFLTSFPSPSLSLLDLYAKPAIEKTNDDEKNKKISLYGSQKNQENRGLKKKDGFSTMNSESLQMCTEGLGFESFDDVDDSGNERAVEDDSKKQKGKGSIMRPSLSESSFGEYKKLRNFPPPIPSIGRNGKPWVCYKSFRVDGRLVLKEVVISTHGQEFMHAYRQHGRLTLHLVHRDQEEIPGNKEDGEDGEQDYGKGKMDKDVMDPDPDPDPDT